MQVSMPCAAGPWPGRRLFERWQRCRRLPPAANCAAGPHVRRLANRALAGPTRPFASGRSCASQRDQRVQDEPLQNIKNAKNFIDDEVQTAVLNLRRAQHAQAPAVGLASAGLSPSPIAGLRRRCASRVGAYGFLLAQQWLCVCVCVCVCACVWVCVWCPGPGPVPETDRDPDPDLARVN